jgi:hypothetical protein
MRPSHLLSLTLCFAAASATGQVPPVVEAANLTELARLAAENGQQIRLKPGVHRLAEYLTEEVLDTIRQGIDRSQQRPTVPMFIFAGSGNHFDFSDTVLEIDTTLYAKLPGGGYVRCLFVAGNDNTFSRLTVRNTGPNQGSNGNILAIFGEGNTFEDATLHVHGSSPYGYGDLLGKGGPNLVHLRKQSGIQIMGSRTTLRRCQVISRAFGHCFYIQGGEGIRLEDCRAEGVMRSTSAMLRDREGPVYEQGFASINQNRDGRHLITAGYMKSLVEDGFRTYSGARQVTLVNCTAVNTRSGFEIGAPDDSPVKTTIENATALGCERGYMIGSHVVIRHSRGDIAYGPLLYLRGGQDSDIELELVGTGSDYTVHYFATLTGTGHRVRFSAGEPAPDVPAVPIMLGFGQPPAGETSSPIRPAPAHGITLVNELPFIPVIVSEEASDSTVETAGQKLSDADSRCLPRDRQH